MTGDHGPFTHSLEAWLDSEDDFLDTDAVLARALEQVETKPQRRADSWPDWRSAVMNKTVSFVAAAAAVVVIAAIGFGVLGGFGGDGLGGPAPSAEPSSEPTATPQPTPEPTTADGGLAEGPYVISDGEVRITVEIAASGWFPLSEFEAVSKDDDGLDAPESVGAALLAWAWPAGTEFNVFGDPCQWTTTTADSPATTPDEIAAALAAQAQSNATAPVDVTVGGYSGKTITLHVPMSYEVPGSTREEEFGECDQDVFAYYGLAADPSSHERNAQGPGQIDELWILDVDESIVIIDAFYSPATPADLVDELRAIAESATFEAP